MKVTRCQRWATMGGAARGQVAAYNTIGRCGDDPAQRDQVTARDLRWGRSSEVAHLSSLKVLVEYWTQTTKQLCPASAGRAPLAQDLVLTARLVLPGQPQGGREHKPRLDDARGYIYGAETVVIHSKTT